jgi:hypothetical protein
MENNMRFKTAFRWLLGVLYALAAIYLTFTTTFEGERLPNPWLGSQLFESVLAGVVLVAIPVLFVWRFYKR